MGGFTEAPGSPIAVGECPASIVTGNFTGDGYTDLAVANQCSGTVSVLLGNDAGGFTQAPGSPISVGASPDRLAVGDFTGNGNEDLAVTSNGSNKVTILLGNGAGEFTPAPGSPIATGGGDPISIAVGDFTGTGKQDLAIVDYYFSPAGPSDGPSGVSILLGNGAGGFVQAPGSPIAVPNNAYSVAVGDFTGNGKLDLAIGRDAAVTVLLGNGAGGFTEAPDSPITDSLGGTVKTPVVGDFTGDGHDDIAVANQDLGTVSVLLGDGAGGFTEASGSPIAVGYEITAIALGYFGGDFPSLVALNCLFPGCNTAPGTVSVLVNSASKPSDASYPASVLADDPVGYWRLGDARDTSVMSDATGNFPGTYVNGAGGSPQLGIAGDGSTAAYFVGNDQYGYVNNIPAPQKAYTMEAWVLPQTANAGMIMQQGSSGALYINSSGEYVFVPNSNEVHVQVVDTNPADVVPSGGATAFHQVVGTWNGTTATLYVDGREVASTPSTQAPAGDATLYIGYGTLAPWFRGYIDEAAYYAHVLTPERVLAHYQADPPPPLWAPGEPPAIPPMQPLATPTSSSTESSLSTLLGAGAPLVTVDAAKPKTASKHPSRWRAIRRARDRATRARKARRVATGMNFERFGISSA